jgi:hypothetical protein
VLHISGGNLDTVYNFKGLLGEHVQIVSPDQLSDLVLQKEKIAPHCEATS